MLSEEAKRELLEAAASASLRRDFQIMSDNSRRIGRRMSLDELMAFLTTVQRMFGPPAKPSVHEEYQRTLI